MTKKQKLSALDAARLILEQAGVPLHYEEITKRILASGLWQTNGKTPAATLSAQLSTSIKKLGTASPFVHTSPGNYCLNTSPKQQTSVPCAVKPVATSVPTPKTISFTEAAERILEASATKQLHYRDITRYALEQHLLDTTGKTPEATMYAQILTEVKRRRNRRETQRFMMLGKGMISLAKWQASGIAYQVDEANKQAREKLLKHIKTMKPYDFENLVSQLLLALGFEEVEVTSRSNDGGIDVRGTLVVGDVIRTRLAVQVKRWKNNVQAPVIQQVRGSLGTHEQGLIITTSDFSKGAREEATRANATPVGLMDGDQLVDLLIQNEIGITLTPLQLIQLYTPGAIQNTSTQP
jgi:restriction system protein